MEKICARTILSGLRILLCFVPVLIHLTAYSQPGQVENADATFFWNARELPREKVFVHTDKAFYVPGETLWFKAYDVQADDLTPSKISKVLYAELLATDGKVLTQAMIRLKDGRGEGSFVIPSTVNTGHYRFRAYTAWMKNFDPEYFFAKTVTLVNPFRSPNWTALERRQSYSLRFFPEGGDLIDGRTSWVAFQATDQYGNGVNCSGAIVDQRNDTVARFETLKFGMGRFNFTPTYGNSYRPVVTNPVDGPLSASFPDIKRSGYVMHLQRIAGHITIAVTAKGNNEGTVYLVVNREHRVIKAFRASLNGDSTVFTLDTAVLGAGVNTFTLFNGRRKPVCERIFFKKPDRRLHLEVQMNKALYSPRAEADVAIRSLVGSAPAKANLSTAVYLTDSLQRPGGPDIFYYLWLHADLRGPVESPEYYFEGNDQQVEEATDNLMLTQGWRRFEPKVLDTGTGPAFIYVPEYEGPVMTAKITDKRSGKPVSGAITALSIPGERFDFGSAVSNDSGILRFVLKEHFGTGELVITQPPASEGNIDVVSPFSTAVSGWRPPAFRLPEAWRDQLLQHSVGSQVQQSFSADLLAKVTLPADADTTAFYGVPDKRYDLDNYTRFPTMEEVMREFVMNVRVRKENGRFRMQAMNIPYQTYFSEDPLMLIDGVPVSDADKIFAFDPLKVKRIDVVAHKFFHGNTVANGIVSFQTYNGDLASFELDPNAIVLDYQGLQLQKQFYAPVYDTPEEIQSRLPDNRNVLLWSPEISTDAQGNYRLRFSTSDIPGNFIIVVQGAADNGATGSVIVPFSVKEER